MHFFSHILTKEAVFAHFVTILVAPEPIFASYPTHTKRAGKTAKSTRRCLPTLTTPAATTTTRPDTHNRQTGYHRYHSRASIQPPRAYI